MTHRRPRSVLAFALVMLGVIVGLFTIALLDTRSDKREAADRRFQDRARVAAALTESLFASTAPQAAERNRQQLGGERVERGALDQLVERSRLAYAVAVDDRGVPLAASSGTPAAALRRIARRPEHVRTVLDGEAYHLTGLTGDAGALEFAAAFESRAGNRRVIVQGFPVGLLAPFLGGYLAGLPGAEGERAFVLDKQGRVLGTAEEGQTVGARVRGSLHAALAGDVRFGEFDGGGRVFASEPIAHSDWKVVITEEAGALYREAGGMLEWLILVALGVAGLFTVMLLHRDARSAARLRAAFDRLSIVNAELEHSNFELKRSNAELEQFASVASHDLQEPLRKVQTFGDQLERRFGDQIPDEATDFLRRMRRAAERMSTLIDDLLRFSRVTTHARPPRRVDLARIAREVTVDLDALVAETGGRVEIGAMPTIEADPLQMRQLLQNLIGNALKFHRPDVAPVVTLEEVPSAEPSGVAFTVADNGIGFEPVYADRIFRVFERLHPRDVYQGTGIGLALCRKIVERHGGTIDAAGVPDSGATFTITLPYVQPSPGARSSGAVAPPSGGAHDAELQHV